MSDSPKQWTVPKIFEPTGAESIGDQALLLAAPMIPGCAARRYDFLLFGDYSSIDLCFSDSGPIATKISLTYGKYYSLVIPNVYYQSMLRDAKKLGGGFSAPGLAGSDRLDSGLEKIAATLAELASKYDFPAMLAGATPEHLIAQYSNKGNPWWDLFLAEYATYLGRTDDAREMLRTAVKLARDSGRANLAGLIAEAEDHLAKLDAGVLRQELVATMEYNWAHFKVVETSSHVAA